jgi:hypothetical protein
MAGNPFFSGRIPQDLHDRIQDHCSKTGETKTQVLINALSAYLKHPVKLQTDSTGISHQDFAALQEQVAALQESIQITNQAVIAPDNIEIGLIKEKIELLVTHQERVDIFLACVPMKLQELEEQIKTLSPVISPDNIDNKASDVNGNIDAPSPSKPESLEEQATDATYLEEPEYKESPGKLLSELPKSLNGSELSRRLGVAKSVISSRKARGDFQEWTRGKDPDAIAWRYDRKSLQFFPVKERV